MSYPCAEKRCPAVVREEGERCVVHRKAKQGPYASPCERCGKKITEDDLWVRARRPGASDLVDYPWHYACRPGTSARLKTPKRKKNWTTGLGLFE